MPGDRESRIRDKAHELWEKEGRPHGSDKRHWEQAEREVGGGEAAPGKPSRAKPGAKPAIAPAATKPKASRAKKPS